MTPEQTLELLTAVQGIVPALKSLANAVALVGLVIAMVGTGIIIFNK